MTAPAPRVEARVEAQVEAQVEARVGPQVGEPAPDVELEDQHGAVLRLADFRGDRPVVLVFYPFAFSRVCTGELCEIRDDLSDGLGILAPSGVQVIGVSCDPVHAQRAWADAEGFDFPLLSDFWPHGEVARRYGVFDHGSGFATRGSFLVDAGGVLRWALVHGPGQARPLSAYREALAALASAAGPASEGP